MMGTRNQSARNSSVRALPVLKNPKATVLLKSFCSNQHHQIGDYQHYYDPSLLAMNASNPILKAFGTNCLGSPG